MRMFVNMRGYLIKMRKEGILVFLFFFFLYYTTYMAPVYDKAAQDLVCAVLERSGNGMYYLSSVFFFFF